MLCVMGGPLADEVTTWLKEHYAHTLWERYEFRPMYDYKIFERLVYTLFVDERATARDVHDATDNGRIRNGRRLCFGIGSRVVSLPCSSLIRVLAWTQLQGDESTREIVVHELSTASTSARLRP